MLQSFRLMVASRGGPYRPPVHLDQYIQTLPLSLDLEDISATDIRRRIREGAAWQHLVPPELVPAVTQIYLPDR